MTDNIPAQLVAAGFVETSPGCFERGAAVIRTGSTPAPPFHIFSVEHRSHPAFDAPAVGSALRVARAVGGFGELANTIAGDAMGDVAFALTGNSGALDLQEGRSLPPHARAELEAMAARMAAFIITESLRAGLIPDSPLP